MRRQFKLVHAEARRRAIEAIHEAPEGYVVEVKPATRTTDQNALLHALLQQLDGREWFGKARSIDEWKVLMVSAHAAATKRDSEVVPGLEGELVAIRESTARMTKSRLSSLVSYIQAWIDSEGK